MKVYVLQGLLLSRASSSTSSVPAAAFCRSTRRLPAFHYHSLWRASLLAATEKRKGTNLHCARKRSVGPVASAAAGFHSETTSSRDTRSQPAEAYYEKKRKALGAWIEERRGRDLCERCRRARKMCLCSALPDSPLPTATRFIILQHPAETKKRVTGTVPLVLHCLSNCRRVVVRSDFGEDSLRKILGIGGSERGIQSPSEISSESSSERAAASNTSAPLLLFPYQGAEYLEDIVASRELAASSAQRLVRPPALASPPGPRSPSPSPSPSSSYCSSSSSLLSFASARSSVSPSAFPGAVVVLIDGTWSQAKQILSRYPSLSSLELSADGTGGRGLRLTATPAPGASPPTGGSGGSGGSGTSILGTANCSHQETGKGDEKETGGRGGRGGTQRPRQQGRGGGGENRGSGGGALCRAVKFKAAGDSGYGFRREPAKECISTLESIAYTLEVLEGTTPEGASAATHLRRAFSAMVAMQVEAADTAGGRPRFVDRRGRTANRRSTPPRQKPAHEE